MNKTDAAYQFHAQEISYFSAKVRCALRHKGLWFEEIHNDYEQIRERTKMLFIPILVTPEDETWQDSSDIFDALEARHPKPPLFAATPRQRIAARLIELYVDEFALLPAMVYRWGTPSRLAASVEHFAALFGPMARRSAEAMIQRTGSLGINEATRAPIEAHTVDLLAALSAHFEAHEYLLGGRLSDADCALMGPLYAHFFNDAEPRKLLFETALPIVGWIDRCNAPVSHRRGELLAGDALAPTLIEVLRSMATDGLPLILATLQEADRWAAAQAPGTEVPRRVGEARALLRGVEVERVALPYCLYMYQRVTDAIDALSDPDRKLVRESLSSTGWDPVFEYRPTGRVRKQGFELEIAKPQAGKLR